MKGEPGKDANLLLWIEKRNGYAAELGEGYIATPKMFSGTESADGKLTGIVQGKKCLTDRVTGEKHTDIFALVGNEIVFTPDPILKGYLFTGQIKIANNKIILNRDGDGHLASGNLKWDSTGNIDISGVLQTPYTSVYIEPSTTCVLDPEKHRYAYIGYRDNIVEPIGTITIPSPTEGLNGSEVRLSTRESGLHKVHEIVYITIQYGLLIRFLGYSYYDKNLSTGPTLCSLRLAGKEAILGCVSSSGSMSWYLQNYSDFAAEELNPI